MKQETKCDEWYMVRQADIETANCRLKKLYSDGRSTECTVIDSLSKLMLALR